MIQSLSSLTFLKSPKQKTYQVIKVNRTRNNPKISKFNFMGKSIPFEQCSKIKLQKSPFAKYPQNHSPQQPFSKSKSLKLVHFPTNQKELLKEAITEIQHEDNQLLKEELINDKNIDNLNYRLFSLENIRPYRQSQPNEFVFFPDDSFGNDNPQRNQKPKKRTTEKSNIKSVELDNKIEIIIKILGLEKIINKINHSFTLNDMINLNQRDLEEINISDNQKKNLMNFLIAFKKYIDKYSIQDELTIGDIIRFFNDNKKYINNKVYFNSLRGKKDSTNSMQSNTKTLPKSHTISPLSKINNEVFVPFEHFTRSSPSYKNFCLSNMKENKHVHKYNRNIKKELISKRLLMRFQQLNKEVEFFINTHSHKK